MDIDELYRPRLSARPTSTAPTTTLGSDSTRDDQTDQQPRANWAKVELQNWERQRQDRSLEIVAKIKAKLESALTKTAAPPKPAEDPGSSLPPPAPSPTTNIAPCPPMALSRNPINGHESMSAFKRHAWADRSFPPIARQGRRLSAPRIDLKPGSRFFQQRQDLVDTGVKGLPDLGVENVQPDEVSSASESSDCSDHAGSSEEDDHWTRDEFNPEFYDEYDLQSNIEDDSDFEIEGGPDINIEDDSDFKIEGGPDFNVEGNLDTNIDNNAEFNIEDNTDFNIDNNAEFINIEDDSDFEFEDNTDFDIEDESDFEIEGNPDINIDNNAEFINIEDGPELSVEDAAQASQHPQHNNSRELDQNPPSEADGTNAPRVNEIQEATTSRQSAKQTRGGKTTLGMLRYDVHNVPEKDMHADQSRFLTIVMPRVCDEEDVKLLGILPEGLDCIWASPFLRSLEAAHSPLMSMEQRLKQEILREEEIRLQKLLTKWLKHLCVELVGTGFEETLKWEKACCGSNDPDRTRDCFGLFVDTHLWIAAEARKGLKLAANYDIRKLAALDDTKQKTIRKSLTQVRRFHASWVKVLEQLEEHLRSSDDFQITWNKIKEESIKEWRKDGSKERGVVFLGADADMR